MSSESPPLAGQAPGLANLRARTGDHFEVTLELFDVDDLPVDATSWTLAGQVRETYGGLLLATMTVDQIGLQPHQVRLSIPSGTMVGVPEGVWPWDLERTAGGPSRRTLLAGVMAVSADVTVEV